MEIFAQSPICTIIGHRTGARPAHADLRSDSAFRALRVSDSSPLVGSWFPSKNFFNIGAPTVAYRTFPCLDKSFGRCPIRISFSKCKTHSYCPLLGGLSTLAHTLVCDRKTKTGGAAVQEGTQPQTANLLRRRVVAIDCCACRKRSYAA